VYRYNHSRRYVDLVLAIADAYLAGDYTEVPNGTTSTGFTLGTPPRVSNADHHVHHHHTRHHGHHSPTTSDNDQPTTGPTTGPATEPSTGPTGAPTHSPKPPTVTLPGDGPTVTVPTLPLPTPTILTRTEAVVQCLAQGLFTGTLAFDECVAELTGG
jgi:hypothetical protein